jgi:hypothetical protein
MPGQISCEPTVEPNNSKPLQDSDANLPTTLFEETELERLSDVIHDLEKTSNDYLFTEKQLDEILGPLSTIQGNLSNLKSSLLKNNEPLIMVIGDSANGKSTSIHFLFHPEPLKVKRDGSLEHPNPFQGSSIGEGVHSCTLCPTFISTEKNGLVVDMPGTNDSRGAFYQLVIHLCYAMIMNSGKPLKFMLVQRHPKATTLMQPFLERANLEMFQEGNFFVFIFS